MIRKSWSRFGHRSLKMHHKLQQFCRLFSLHSRKWRCHSIIDRCFCTALRPFWRFMSSITFLRLSSRILWRFHWWPRCSNLLYCAIYKCGSHMKICSISFLMRLALLRKSTVRLLDLISCTRRALFLVLGKWYNNWCMIGKILICFRYRPISVSSECQTAGVGRKLMVPLQSKYSLLLLNYFTGSCDRAREAS